MRSFNHGIFLLSWLILTGAAKVPSPERQLIDKIVAVIDQDLITWQQLQQKAKLRPPDSEHNLMAVLQEEINERLLKQEMQRTSRSIAASEKDIDKAIADVLKQNHIDLAQLKSTLYLQNVSYTDYRERLRFEIEKARFMQTQVQAKIANDKQSLQTFCRNRPGNSQQETICAQHILISQIHADARSTIYQVRSQLQTGSDFNQLVAKVSDDRNSVDGFLGCFHLEDTVDEMRAAIGNLAVGKISPVVHTAQGYHVVKITKRGMEDRNCEDETVLLQLQPEYVSNEMTRQMNQYLESLKEKVFIEVFLKDEESFY